jgi:hypothetical protein
MIPLYDNVPSRSFPVVNTVMIVLCGLAFAMQLMEGPDKQTIVERYGMIPFRVTHPGQSYTYKEVQVQETRYGPKEVVTERAGLPAGVPAVFTLLTCIFLHGGWMHFIGNMLFLFIFGDNVEDCFGKVGYLVLYLVGGVMASMSHLLTDPSSTVPTIGASGAIAAVMGSYFVLYPHAGVMTLLPLGVLTQMFVVPAPVFLGLWFVMQTVSGVGGLVSGQAEGVAWWAHIGGFAFGVIVAFIMKTTHLMRPVVQERVPMTDRRNTYRVRRS